MKEIWKKLVYPNISDANNRFEISSFGNIRNKNTLHIYKQSLMSSGYYSIRTSIGSKTNKITIMIHRAVANTFLSNPNNLPEVNHIDGNKTNNCVSNLEWSTSHHNQKHKYDNGLINIELISGENNHNAKLTKEDVKYIQQKYISGSREFGVRALARKFNVAHTTILSIIKGKTWCNTTE